MSFFSLVLAVSTAHAAPVSWQWSGETSRYHAETLIKTQSPLRFLARQNLDARPSEITLALDLTCRGEDLKKGWTVVCDIDNVAMQGKAWPGEQEKLDAILAEYSQDLDQATLQLEVLADGRINSVDLEGVPKADNRQSQIHEVQRLLLRRAVMPLDLQVTNAAPVVDKTWKQKGHPLALELMSKYGTSGGSVLKHRVVGVDGDLVRVESEGRGNVGTGANIDAGSSALVNLVVVGTGVFDAAAGRMVYRQVSAQGELNQQSVAPPDATYWAQIAWVALVYPDGTLGSQQAK